MELGGLVAAARPPSSSPAAEGDPEEGSGGQASAEFGTNTSPSSSVSQSTSSTDSDGLAGGGQARGGERGNPDRGARLGRRGRDLRVARVGRPRGRTAPRRNGAAAASPQWSPALRVQTWIGFFLVSRRYKSDNMDGLLTGNGGCLIKA
jgi:hypothetical protein